jgi:large subunit ribosomal protein L31
MKAGLHPNYVQSTVTCACGNVFTTRSTKPELRTDLCSVCHPFYTGEQRIVDTAGQVERFTRRMEAAASAGPKVSKRQQRLAERAAEVAERERQEREERERQEVEDQARASERARREAAQRAEAAGTQESDSAVAAPARSSAGPEESASDAETSNAG